MNEKEFTSRIREHLEQGSRQIDGITLKKLEAARHQALVGARVAERDLVMASHSDAQRGAATLRFHDGAADGPQPHVLRVLFVGLALIALMAGTAYWQQANDDDDGEQGLLDAKMLSSELPLYTFLHPDFKEWVDRSR
jgi:hypothetical protein